MQMTESMVKLDRYFDKKRTLDSILTNEDDFSFLSEPMYQSMSEVSIVLEKDNPVVENVKDVFLKALPLVHSEMIKSIDGINNKKMVVEYEGVVPVVASFVSKTNGFDAPKNRLLDALAMIGVVSEQQVYKKHCRNIFVSSAISECGPLYLGTEMIKKIEFPNIGCDRMTTNVLRKCTVLRPKGLTRHSGVERYILGAREKLDGESAMIFSITLCSCEVPIFYLWDDENIRIVDVDRHYYLEKVKGKYYNLNLDGSAYHGLDIDILSNPYQFLTMEKVESCKEGLMLLVDGLEYKVPRVKTFTVSCEEKRCYDKERNEYPVHGVHNDGMIDVLADGNDFVFTRHRRDRYEPDSAQSILVVLRNMVILKDLTRAIEIPYDTGVLFPKQFEVSFCNRINRVSSCNNLIEGQCPLLYNIESSASSYFYSCRQSENNKSYIYFLADDRTGCVGSKKNEEYKYEKAYLLRGDEFVISNLWFPCCFRLDLKMSCFNQIFFGNDRWIWSRYYVVFFVFEIRTTVLFWITKDIFNCSCYV